MNVSRAAILGLVFLNMLSLPASAALSEASARQEALDSVRSKLSLRSEQFLDIKRDENLELSLMLCANRPIGPVSIYRLSSTGYEMKEKAIIHHFSMDADLDYIVAVSLTDGNIYRLAGFRDSRTEFNGLLVSLRIGVPSANQAEAIADFYRAVNPEHEVVTNVSNLLDLKQAAERQCQAVPFDPRERDFEAWWKHAKTAYANVSFQQTATRNGSGYAVDWVVLSSPGAGLCGGSPLRARLEVGSDGNIGEISFRPF
jgi:hypothetical protein